MRQLSGKVPLQRRDGEALKAACRFAATENGVTRFRGVIDEWSAVCGAEGTVLTVEGRGMAAPLFLLCNFCAEIDFYTDPEAYFYESN